MARGKIGSCDMIVARKMKGFRNRTDWPLMLHRRNNFRKESSPKWTTKAYGVGHNYDIIRLNHMDNLCMGY